MAQSFFAQVRQFQELTKDRLESVVKGAATEMFRIAQTPKAKGGRMPVDTGFLRNSLVTTLNGGRPTEGATSYIAAISGFQLGDSIEGGWTAEYARHVEYGTTKMAGSFYALSAAQQWPALVNKHAIKAMSSR